MKNTLYIKNGTEFIPTDDANLDIQSRLPVGTYIIKKKPMGGPLYFDKVNDFSLPPKIYGDTLKNSQRILSSFNDRHTNTGVLLSGEKGSGKTLLAKHLSINSGLPVILVNEPLKGEEFNQLISGIGHPAVIFFDEFEKVYREPEDQEALLTLLDGVFSTKKLFILTCNDKYKVNEHMRNRPGRLFYFINYKGVKSDFIREYCEDRLLDKKHTDAICNLAMLFDNFSFDMLSSLVEEMNRFGEDPHEAIKILNAQPDTLSSYGEFTVKILDTNEKEMKVISPVNGVLSRSPLSTDHWMVSVTSLKTKPIDNLPMYSGEIDIYELEEEQKKKIKSIAFFKRQVFSVDHETGTIVYKSDDGYTAVVTRKIQTYHGMAF